jgi:hypothetical protein
LQVAMTPAAWRSQTASTQVCNHLCAYAVTVRDLIENNGDFLAGDDRTMMRTVTGGW